MESYFNYKLLQILPDKNGKYASSVTDVSDLNVVTAYATGTGLCLGQQVAGKKMNEPEQLRKLVESLYLAGTIITADALHCQKNTPPFAIIS